MKLDPEDNETGVGVSAAHVADKPYLFRLMLVRMTVRPVRTVCQRLKSSVIALAPAVDIFPVRAISYGRFFDSVFLSIQN